MSYYLNKKPKTRHRNVELHLFLVLFMLLASCSRYPNSPEYIQQYEHLSSNSKCCSMQESPFFLVLLVDARHLDYSDNRSLLKTIVKHPSDGSKNSDVGHAWIYLEGIVDDQKICIEGGHSGELGTFQPKYFEGVMDHIDSGDPDPIQYLWATQYDGFFQEGSGGHVPSYAVKIDISSEQFQNILSYIDPKNYFYREYALICNQCSSFVVQVASIIDFPLENEITIEIKQEISLGGQIVHLWTDPHYSQLTISTPDILERSLMEAVSQGRAEYALDWYLKNHPKPLKDRFQKTCEDIYLLPQRLQRLFLFF